MTRADLTGRGGHALREHALQFGIDGLILARDQIPMGFADAGVSNTGEYLSVIGSDCAITLRSGRRRPPRRLPELGPSIREHRDSGPAGAIFDGYFLRRSAQLAASGPKRPHRRRLDVRGTECRVCITVAVGVTDYDPGPAGVDNARVVVRRGEE